jgi:hypothetical protein
MVSWIFVGVSVKYPGKLSGLLDHNGNPVDSIEVMNLLSRDGFR